MFKKFQVANLFNHYRDREVLLPTYVRNKYRWIDRDLAVSLSRASLNRR